MNKNKGFIGIGLIIAIVLGIAVVGGGAYYLGKSSKVENKEVVENSNIQNKTEVSNSHEVPTGPFLDETNYVAPKPLTTNLITILSPNGGGVYKSGDNITVKWKTSDDISKTVNNIWIGLNNTTNAFDLVKTQILNDGTENVIIPNNIPSGKYQIVVTVYGTGANNDMGTVESYSNFITINNATVVNNNLIKQTGCGVSFSKTSDWSVISNTSNETVLDIPSADPVGRPQENGIDIKCVSGNSITDTDAKFGKITYYYDSSSQKWMVNNPDEEGIGMLTLPAVVATPLFTVNGWPVFRGAGRWLTYIIPVSSSSILSLHEGDTEGGSTQSLTNLVNTLKKL